MLTSVIDEEAGAPFTVTTSAAGVPSCVVKMIEVEKLRKKPLPAIVTVVEFQASSSNETTSSTKRLNTAARTVETPWPGARRLRKNKENTGAGAMGAEHPLGAPGLAAKHIWKGATCRLRWPRRFSRNRTSGGQKRNWMPRRVGCKLVNWTEPEYLQSRLQICDPPVVLYVRGDARILNSPSLAIVGTRRPTVYGTQMADRMGRDGGWRTRDGGVGHRDRRVLSKRKQKAL
jgi:hypothetical protein